MKIYRIRALHLVEHFATRALAAQALQVTDAFLQSLVASNLAAGSPAYPISAKVPMGLSGRLALFRTDPEVMVYLDEIDVRETYP